MAPIALGVVAAAAGLAVWRRMAAPAEMPHKGTLRRALAEKRGEAEAQRLVELVQARYDELCAEQPHISSPALRFHLRWGILPGLAVYQTLLAEGDDRQTATAEVEAVTAATAAGFRKLMPVLAWFPDPFRAFRWFEHWVVQLGFPPEGWEVEPVEDSDRCVAFNVRRCVYLDTLTSYGAPELTAVYCSGDDVAFDALPASITWERTKTIGRGDDLCNFRWCRADRVALAGGSEPDPGSGRETPAPPGAAQPPSGARPT